MAKKRPSLKDFLATGDVIMDDEGRDTAEEKTATTPKKEASKKSSPKEKKKAPAKKKSPSEGIKTPAKRTSKKKDPAGGKKDPRLEGLIKILAPSDLDTWEKLLTAADVAFQPLDLVERREDFRTMARDRYTLFRLEEQKRPLLHVRTSVQIREPLERLIKLDETGQITVYAPAEGG